MPRSNPSSILSRIVLSTALLVGAATLATPAEAADAYSYTQFGGVHTLAYKTLNAVATYRTETRAGADWLILDVYYSSARADTIVKIGRGNFSDGSVEYTVSASGVTRTGGSTTATGSRTLDGQFFHVELPLAEASALSGTASFNFIFHGTSAGTFSYMHPVPQAPLATVSQADYDQCQSEVKTLRTRVKQLEAKLGGSKTPTLKR